MIIILKKAPVAALLFTLVALGSSCVSSSTVPEAGIYQGTLISAAPVALQKYAVSADLTYLTDGSLHLAMTGNPTLNTTLDIALSKDEKSANLTIPGTAIQNQKLDADSKCFSSPTIRLCSTHQSIVISATDSTNHPIYSLSLEYFGGVASDIHLEKPQTFTLDQAVAYAMQNEFNTRIEFQHMLQARLIAKNAYLDLMPHLSNDSIFGLATGGPLTVIAVLGMAGDLVPFLFPSRWEAAKESGQLSAAEEDALALMRGDTGLNVEILAYTIDHDTREMAFLTKDYADLVVIDQKVTALEAQGLVPAGTEKHVQSMMASMHDAMDDISYPLQAEQAAMAQAMGFVNPLAVSAVEVPDNLPTHYNDQDILRVADFEALVLGRSIELRQMDHLTDAAKTAKTADYYNWLDPEADLSQTLGFGLGATIQIDQSQIVSLGVQKNQTASTLLQNLAGTIIQYNHSTDDMDDSASGINLEQSRKDQLMAALDSGKPVSADEITSIPFDQLTWQINSLDAQLDNRSSFAKMNRMLLQGYYANLDGHLTGARSK